MHSNGDCTDVRYHTKIYESWQKNCVFRLYLDLARQIMEFKYKQAYKMIKTGILVWKTKNMKSYRSFFFALVAKCLKLNDELTCITASPNLKTNFCGDDKQEGGRKYCITEVHPFLIHWWVVYAILLLCWSTACFITLLSFTQHFYKLLSYTQSYYIVEVYPILILCLAILKH